MATSSSNRFSDSSEPETNILSSNKVSIISSATSPSIPCPTEQYEPILQTVTHSPEDSDPLPHQFAQTDRILSLPRWSQSNITPVADEKKGFVFRRKLPTRKRVALLRWGKNALQTVISLWTIYNTARYLIAFTIYESQQGQSFSVAMGISTGLSFASSACASFLYATQRTLLFHGFSVQGLVSLRSTLHYISSCLLLGPAIINLVLVFLWKKTLATELQIQYRCGLDVDIVWSIKSMACSHKSFNWGFWVGLSALRFILTLAVLIVFHAITSSSQLVPVRRNMHHLSKSKNSHNRLDSCQVPLISGDHRVDSPVSHANLQQQRSDSVLTTKSSPRNRLHPSRSRSSANSDGHQSAAPSYHTEFITSSVIREPTTEHFDNLLSQIAHETEQGLAFARSNSTSSSEQSTDSLPSQEDEEDQGEDATRRPASQNYDADDDDDFYVNPSQSFSTRNFLPLYHEEEIPIVNRFIRRMPTIESAGSMEWRSSVGASSMNTNRDKERTSLSRPATRTGRRSWAGSDLSGNVEPRSRSASSLAAQAEILSTMFGNTLATEIGELMRRGDTLKIVDPQSSSSEAFKESGSASTTGSKDSYHTATTGSGTNSRRGAE